MIVVYVPYIIKSQFCIILNISQSVLIDSTYLNSLPVLSANMRLMGLEYIFYMIIPKKLPATRSGECAGHATAPPQQMQFFGRFLFKRVGNWIG